MGDIQEDTWILDSSLYASLLAMGRDVDGAPTPLLMRECIA